MKTASLIFAAGKGSRMKGFDGNKTLLPLIPDQSIFQGRQPILLHLLYNLPQGPKALVVNYKKEEVIKATLSFKLTYCEQSVLNGTGGALLAARKFIEEQDYDRLIITMGDVPFISAETYRKLVKGLKHHSMVVLGFCPEDKKQYGLIETVGDAVTKIIEWKYWKSYPKDSLKLLRICNSGIYAARKDDLVPYLLDLEKSPHVVSKERDGKLVKIEEYFITDLVELLGKDGLGTGYVIAGAEDNAMGVDDLSSLKKAQGIFMNLS